VCKDLRRGFPKEHRLALNSLSSYLYLLSGGFTDVCHHAQLILYFLWSAKWRLKAWAPEVMAWVKTLAHYFNSWTSTLLNLIFLKCQGGTILVSI
jgi:hypothetical protein